MSKRLVGAVVVGLLAVSLLAAGGALLWADAQKDDRGNRGGDRRPARPADQSFWTASAHGPGTQTVTWDLEDGDWSVVVMNEDASRGVDATISAGATVPFLAALGWVAIGGGVLLLVGAGALLVPVAPRAGDRSRVAG